MNIFVARLNPETTAENLSKLFSLYGNVASSKVIIDRISGKSKCYGFIEMNDEEEALNAIKNLNEFDFMNSNIVPRKSEP